jgi:hypothetical protein
MYVCDSGVSFLCVHTFHNESTIYINKTGPVLISILIVLSSVLAKEHRLSTKDRELSVHFCFSYSSVFFYDVRFILYSTCHRAYRMKDNECTYEYTVRSCMVR